MVNAKKHMNKFNDLENYGINAVWIGSIVDKPVKEFENYFFKKLHIHIKVKDEFILKGGRYDGLNCIIFGIFQDELIPFFALKLQYADIKFLIDLYDIECENIPSEIVEKYSLDAHSIVSERIDIEKSQQ